MAVPVQELQSLLRENLELSEKTIPKLKKEGELFNKKIETIYKEVQQWERDLIKYAKDEQIGKTITELKTLLTSTRNLMLRITASKVFLKLRFGKACKKLLTKLEKIENVLGMGISYIKARAACDGLAKLGLIAGYPALDVMDFDDAKNLSLQADKHFFGHGVIQNYEAAFRLYLAAARLDDPRSQFIVGKMYLEGLGVEKSEESAVSYLLKSANDHDYPDALNHIGMFCESGETILEQDFGMAAKYYRKAAERGHLDGMTNYGHLLLMGKGTVKNEREAISWFKKAADKNYAKAQNHLGNIYFHGLGAEVNYERAVEYFKKAAEKGDPLALNNLGVCYEEGKGVVRDFATSTILYESAARQGNVSAINNLGYIKLLQHQFEHAKQLLHEAADRGSVDALYNIGMMYDKGLGVSEDIDHAFIYYYKAAEQDHPKACKRVADVFYFGIKTVTKDVLQAAKYYYKAALEGNSDAQNNLGIMYEEGIGVDRDMEKATKWYREAAARNNPNACFNLATIYEHGNGVAVNPFQARQYYERAAELGHLQAREKLMESVDLVNTRITTIGTQSVDDILGRTKSKKNVKSLKMEPNLAKSLDQSTLNDVQRAASFYGKPTLSSILKTKPSSASSLKDLMRDPSARASDLVLVEDEEETSPHPI